MNVVEIEVSKLMPYWHNPRKNDGTVEKLVKSIKEYGFNVPLVVNHDMVLITGHARLKAAKKLGLEKVPCVVVNLDETQAKKYRIADNKIQESTEWDEDSLFKELREIANPLDLIDMGFTSDDVKNIVGDIDSLLAETTNIEIAEVPTYTMATPTPVQSTPYTPSTPTPAPVQSMPMIDGGVDKAKLEEQLRQREQELNGRFVRESYEQTQYDNVVVCPHCGLQFKVRGVK